MEDLRRDRERHAVKCEGDLSKHGVCPRAVTCEFLQVYRCSTVSSKSQIFVSYVFRLNKLNVGLFVGEKNPNNSDVVDGLCVPTSSDISVAMALPISW